MPSFSRAKENAIVLAAFLVSGASALIYEVVWTRALSLVLGSTVYALSTMLSTFMAGLAIGSYCGGKLSDQKEDLLLLFGFCELGIGILGLASIPIIYSLPALYLYIYRTFHLFPTLYFTVQIALCAMVMLVPTTLMGATFPLVSKRITVSLAEMGRKVGDAYSFNTIGAVIGSLSVGFFLIPTFGIKGATTFAAILNLATGLSMFLLAKKGIRRSVGVAVPIFVVVALWSGTARLETSLINVYYGKRLLNEKTYREIVQRNKMDMREVFHEENAAGSVRAFKDSDDNIMLQVGGKMEGTSSDDIANTVLLAYLPIATHSSPMNFLTIGLGAGVTLGAAKEHVKNVDLVEINPAVIQAVTRHGKHGLLDGVGIKVNDARNYLLTTDKKYDIISSEPSYPTETVTASLFTKEFYEIAAQRLNTNGIYCQWIPYYMLSDTDVISAMKTFDSVFPFAFLVGVRHSGDLILIGSKEPFVHEAETIRERVERLNAAHSYDFDYYISKTPPQFKMIVQTFAAPMNTDDNPVMEFSAANNLLKGKLSRIDDRVK